MNANNSFLSRGMLELYENGRIYTFLSIALEKKEIIEQIRVMWVTNPELIKALFRGYNGQIS